jgi:hypothetical protein
MEVQVGMLRNWKWTNGGGGWNKGE